MFSFSTELEFNQQNEVTLQYEKQQLWIEVGFYIFVNFYFYFQLGV